MYPYMTIYRYRRERMTDLEEKNNYFINLATKKLKKRVFKKAAQTRI